MYDFALYENITTAINHQKDLHMIARLLLDSGYSVCVLGYCKEQDLGDGIPFIHIPNPYKIPEMESGPKYTILFRQWNFCINKKKYIRHFLNATKGIAHNYYCGSFLNETDSKFFKQDPDANYFFWGLRSHYLSLNYDDFLHPISALDKLQKILFIKNHSNIKFFFLFF